MSSKDFEVKKIINAYAILKFRYLDFHLPALQHHHSRNFADFFVDFNNLIRIQNKGIDGN